MRDRFMVQAHEVRSLIRLVADLRDLPDGSEAQRRTALAGIAGLVGAQVALWLTIDGLTGPNPAIRGALDVGFAGDQERRTFLAYLNGEQARSLDPTLPRLPSLLTPPVTVLTRDQIVSDQEWYGSEHVQEYRRSAGVDSFIYGAHLGASGAPAQCLSLHRPWRDRPFSEGERLLVDLFYRECEFLHEEPRPSITEALPKRLRDTLAGLSKGLSEKEIAADLGLSQHTVHDYVKELHRRFGARSRGELMALLMKTKERRAR